MKAEGSYQYEKLETGHCEATLLAERAQLRLEGFTELASRHGFPSAGRALEVGCGHGIRTRRLAESFPAVEILGVDRSPELLQMACAQNGDLPNLAFAAADLMDLPHADNSFDFVYARLVFMHLAEPELALKSLKRVLKPGGRLLIEDADRDCMFFEPAPLSFAAYWRTVQDGQRRLGGDPNVGRKLAPLLKQFEFTNVQIETQPILGGGADIEFLARTLLPSLNSYLELADRPAADQAVADLLELSRDARATFYHFWFIASGTK